MTKEQLVKTPLTLAFSYTYIKLLGEGANGKTWLGRSKIDGQLVAIKELKTSVMEDMKALELFKREMIYRMVKCAVLKKVCRKLLLVSSFT